MSNNEHTREDLLAAAGRAAEGGTWRIGFLAKGTPHYRFMGSEEAAQRYVEAWALKWEAEIRARVREKAVEPAWKPPSSKVAKEAASRDYARRRGCKKKCPT